MRIHIQYNRLIFYLIEFKDELKRIKEEKYQCIINILVQSEITYNDEDDLNPIPTRNELANQLGLKNIEVNKLLKDIYHELTHSFYFDPLVVDDCKQVVFIHIPYEEWNKEYLKKEPDFYNVFNTSIEVKLPYIPRIGEQIRLPFLEYKNMCTSGYVHAISHSIEGKTQVINIDVHPIDNEYKRWLKMKEEYEAREQWKRFIERQKAYE